MKKPKSVGTVITIARLRRKSERTERPTVATSCTADCAVGIIFCNELSQNPVLNCNESHQRSKYLGTYHHRNGPAVGFHPQREGIDARRRSDVDEDDVENSERPNMPACKYACHNGPAQLTSRCATHDSHAILSKRFVFSGEKQ